MGEREVSAGLVHEPGIAWRGPGRAAAHTPSGVTRKGGAAGSARQVPVQKLPPGPAFWSKNYLQHATRYGKAWGVVDESKLELMVEALLTGLRVRRKLQLISFAKPDQNLALCLNYAVQDRVTQLCRPDADLRQAWHGSWVHLLASILTEGRLRNYPVTKPIKPCVFCFSKDLKAKAAGYAPWQP